MSDTRTLVVTIIGTGVALLASVIALGALLTVQLGSVRTEIASVQNILRAEISAVRAELGTRLDSFDARLRAVEVEFGKVDQRLETLERAIIPSAPPAE